MTERAQGRTRWFAVPLGGLGLAVLTVLYQLVSQGAMGVGFTTADKQFQVYSNYMDGVVAAGYMGKQQTFSGIDGVAQLGVKEARLAGLCMVSTEDIPVAGTVSLVITAGVPVKDSTKFGGAGGDHATFAAEDGTGTPLDLDANGRLVGDSADDASLITDFYLSTDAVEAYANRLSAMALGRSADQVADIGIKPWPAGQAPPVAGNFGLDVQQIQLGDFNGRAFGLEMQSDDIKLKHLKVRTYRGSVGPDPDATNLDRCYAQAVSP